MAANKHPSNKNRHHSLLDASVKIKRADVHISNAIDALGRWHSLYPNGFPVNEKGEAGKDFVNNLVDVILLGVNCEAGDAIHNLRSALDHVAFSMSLKFAPGLSDGERSKVYFPICTNRKSFESFNNRAKIKRRLGRGALTLLRRFQPYEGGNHFLWGIHRYDIIDKHRSLLEIGYIIRERTAQLGRGYLFRTHWRPLREQIRVPAAALGLRGNNQVSRTPQIAFGDVGAFKHRPVGAVLCDMRAMVEKVMWTFAERFFADTV